MDLFNDAAVCDAVDSNLCDAVYGVTGNESVAVASGWLVAKPLAIVCLLLLAVLARWLLHRLIDRLANRAADGVMASPMSRGKLGRASEKVAAGSDIATERREQRVKTMASLMKSIVTGVIFTLVTIMVISELGYDVAPLIASAGIIGVALGFGAQSLVKDFLSGIFLLIEDQFGVGDVIDVGEASGLVEGVSLRTTRLRDVEGTVWYVPNGEIRRVGNKSQQWSRALLDVLVAYETDLEAAIGTIKEVADGVWHDETFGSSVLEEPEVWGVEGFGPTGIAIRLVVKTRPADQWKIMRELRQRLKSALDAAGVQFGFEKTPWLSGAGDPGPAPPAP